MNVKRIAAGTIAGVMLASTLCGCSEASRVRRNLNQEADNFNIQRRITVLNARTDKVLLEMEGTFSLSNNSANELVVTCEVGEGTYQKHYIYLNDYTLYGRGHQRCGCGSLSLRAEHHPRDDWRCEGDQ